MSNKGREGTRRNSHRRRRIRQEVKSLVSSPMTEQVSGTRLRENIQKLRITVQDCTIHLGLRTRIVLVADIGWYELHDHSGRGRRFWRFHPSMSRIFTSSSKPTVQQVLEADH